MADRVLVMMGSESDRPVMQKGVDVLVDAGGDVEVGVSSASPKVPSPQGQTASQPRPEFSTIRRTSE